MEFNATIDLIIKDLNEARAIIDDLKRYPAVPEIQIELAKAKCKSAAEIIALLKNMKNETSFTEKSVVSEIIIDDPVPSGQRSPDEPEEEIKESILSPIDIPIPPAIEESSQISKKSTEASILADTFAQLSDRINEKLGHLKEEEDLTEIIKSKHVSKLTEAIGVNDRFLFLKEIFNNDRNAYNQAMSRLEMVTRIDEAKEILSSYTGNVKETGAVNQLLYIVKRKLHSDE